MVLNKPTLRTPILRHLITLSPSPIPRRSDKRLFSTLRTNLARISSPVFAVRIIHFLIVAGSLRHYFTNYQTGEKLYNDFYSKMGYSDLVEQSFPEKERQTT